MPSRRSLLDRSFGAPSAAHSMNSISTRIPPPRILFARLDIYFPRHRFRYFIGEHDASGVCEMQAVFLHPSEISAGRRRNALDLTFIRSEMRDKAVIHV